MKQKLNGRDFDLLLGKCQRLMQLVNDVDFLTFLVRNQMKHILNCWV